MIFRKALLHDVPEIVRLLADDALGEKRENYTKPLPKTYLQAFEQIHRDSNQALIVVELEGEIIGTMQMSFIPYLTYQGGLRTLIEAVRIDKNYREKGIGKALFLWAIEKARERNSHLVQLTIDKKRAEALKFYTDLGFVASHEGLKLSLS